MHPVEQALRNAIIEAWVKELPATQRALATAVEQMGASMPDPITVSDRQVGIWFTKWAAAGISTTQVASNGHHGAAYAFNWTGRALTACSLLDAVRPALTADDGTSRRDNDANKLRTALRIALGVGEHGSDRLLFEACAQVPATELHALPQRAYEAAIATPRRAGEDGVGKASASNYRATLRAFLRRAAQRDQVPIVLPRVWADDTWEECRDRFFGAPVGNLTQTQKVLRVYWGHFVDGVKALKRPPADFDAVTLETVTVVCDALRARGEHELPQHIKWMLRRIAREHGVGPYAGRVGGRRTRNGWLNEDRLMGPNGEAAADGNWDTFLDMVDFNGFGPTWREFLGWYAEFITLSDHDVDSLPARFPVRPARWELDATTRIKRIINLRMILYHAPRLLGRAAKDLTAYDVFGGDGARKMLAGLEARWKERYRAGQVTSANSSACEQLIIAFGLVARALELRFQHAVARGQDEVTRVLAPVPAERAQAAFAETYRGAGEKAKKVAEARKKEPSGHGDNSQRSVARIVRATPAAYWIAVNDEALRRVQSHFVHDRHGVRTNELHEDVDRKAFYSLVADTFYLGWLISTGMRIEESTHVRLDVQFTPALQAIREVHLRAIDRKETPNTLPHECKLRERYVPKWLETLYLDEARPYFMTVYPTIGKATKGGRVLKRQRPAQEHPWLFVNQFGEAYGCPEEDADGAGRDKLALRGRKDDLRKRFKRFTGRLAHACELPVPTLRGEASNHVVRIAMGYEVCQSLGQTAAANYLGDQEASIIGHYQGVKGDRVNVSVIAPEDFQDWEPPSARARREKEGANSESATDRGRAPRRSGGATRTSSPVSEPPVAPPSSTERLRSELSDLKAMLDEGLMTAEQFAVMREARVRQAALAA